MLREVILLLMMRNGATRVTGGRTAGIVSIATAIVCASAPSCQLASLSTRPLLLMLLLLMLPLIYSLVPTTDGGVR